MTDFDTVPHRKVSRKDLACGDYQRLDCGTLITLPKLYALSSMISLPCACLTQCIIGGIMKSAMRAFWVYCLGKITPRLCDYFNNRFLGWDGKGISI